MTGADLGPDAHYAKMDDALYLSLLEKQTWDHERLRADQLERVSRLVAASAERVPHYRAAYGIMDRPIESLAEFVRGIWIGDSPVDRFQAGDFAALSVEERLGLWVYESKGRCWRCHSGPNFSDEGFHNTGVGAREGATEEARMSVTGKREDRGRFKTPTLRGVALSPPYMHDGSLATLEDVVAFYKKGGGANPANPVFKSFKTSASLLLRDGQSAQHSTATDKVSGDVWKVDVTLNVIK